jgi:glycosyltransferase involved in cell wall biosynthesis
MLFLCADVVGAQMAGVAIRAYELARALQPHADVTIAGVESDAEPLGDVRQVSYDARDPRALRPHIAAADVIFSQPTWPVVTPWLRHSGARLIFDLLTPEPFENLEYLADRGEPLRRLMLSTVVDRIAEALHVGHHFVCAGEKQRDLWIGTMMAERLLSPTTYDRDPTLRSVIDTLPFGVPSEPPVATGEGPRERFGLEPDAEIALWSGGIWRWLDAETSIRAVARLAERRPRVRLVFMAASEAGPAREAAKRAQALAAELGVLDRIVFFNDEWVPYAERGAWLLQADCNLSTHPEHLETRFAFRTRVLDCFWAGLPIVCTGGDELADRVEREDLGATAPSGDVEGTAAALERVLERGRGAYAEGLRRAAEEHAWPRLAEPLVRWVGSPPPPPPLGEGVARRPAHLARNLAFRGSVKLRTTLGIESWLRI